MWPDVLRRRTWLESFGRLRVFLGLDSGRRNVLSSMNDAIVSANTQQPAKLRTESKPLQPYVLHCDLPGNPKQLLRSFDINIDFFWRAPDSGLIPAWIIMRQVWSGFHHSFWNKRQMIKGWGMTWNWSHVHKLRGGLLLWGRVRSWTKGSRSRQEVRRRCQPKSFRRSMLTSIRWSQELCHADRNTTSFGTRKPSQVVSLHNCSFLARYWGIAS